MNPQKELACNMLPAAVPARQGREQNTNLLIMEK